MISKKRKLFLWTVRGGMYLATALTAGLTLFLMVYVLAKGIPNITWELLSTKPSYLAILGQERDLSLDGVLGISYGNFFTLDVHLAAVQAVSAKESVSPEPCIIIPRC